MIKSKYMKENDQLIKVIKYITKEKIIEYANASGDFNPIHIDKDFAKNSQFGQIIAHGMMIAAWVIGKFADLGYNNSYFKSLKSLLIGTSIIFLFGVVYLGSIIGFDKALAAGLYPFILSEFFKILLAVALIPNITKYISK